MWNRERNGLLFTAPIRFSNSQMRVWHAQRPRPPLWRHWVHNLWLILRFSLLLSKQPRLITRSSRGLANSRPTMSFTCAKPLLNSRYCCIPTFTGEATGFVHADWPDDEPRPVYYINRQGAGEVLYLNLGHARGHYDMQPRVPYYPEIERGSWENPEYYELLRRGLKYCAGL